MENSNPKGFVEMCLRRIKSDTACRAALRRADNPATSSAAWQYLAPFCPLNHEKQRLAFSLAGAAMAREMPESNGKLNIGQALRQCSKSAESEDRELARLRRILACSDVMELVCVLPRIVNYIQSKGIAIDYERLIWDILSWDHEKTRIRWAQSFFRAADEEETPTPEFR